MIIEIALAIVLAVLILNFFREILGLAVILLFIALVLAVIGVVAYFAFAEPGVTAVLAVVAALIGGTAYWDSKQHYEKPAPLDPTDSPTSNRLYHDNAESANGTKPKADEPIRWANGIKALWLGRSPGDGRLIVGVGLVATCSIAAIALRFNYVSTSGKLMVVALYMVSAALLFGLSLMLSWLVLDAIRALRKGETPPASSRR